MKKKPVDKFYLMEMFEAWTSYPSRSKERGEVVKLFMKHKGMSKAQVHKLFNELEAGLSIDAVCDRKKPKTKSPEKDKRKKEIVDALAKVKYMDEKGSKSYIKPTKFAMMQAVNMGLVKESELPKDRATIDRWFKDAGLDKKSYARALGVASWNIEAPNAIHFIDASPANRIYISKSNKVVYRPDLDPNDKHLEKELYEKELRYVHIYVLVDGYSGAWYAKAYASDPIGSGSKRAGENSIDLRDMVSEAWTKKPNNRNPFEGIPAIVFGDKGTAFKPLIRFFDKLGIKYAHHFPGNPQAKGMVESRIGAIKRSIEVCMSNKTIKTIDDFNEVLHNHMLFNNQSMGHFDKWLAGTRQHPIRRIDQKNISDALAGKYIRTVNGYGCVSIHTKEIFVNRELTGEKVEVWVNEKRWIARDKQGMVYECDPNGRVYRDSDFKLFRLDEEGKKHRVSDEFADSEKEKRRKRIKEEAIPLSKTSLKEDIMYPESKLRYYPAPSVATKTHSPVAPEFFTTVDSALTYILDESKITYKELHPGIRDAVIKALESTLDLEHRIPAGLVYKLTNSVLKHHEKLEAINETK